MHTHTFWHATPLQDWADHEASQLRACSMWHRIQSVGTRDSLISHDSLSDALVRRAAHVQRTACSSCRPAHTCQQRNTFPILRVNGLLSDLQLQSNELLLLA